MLYTREKYLISSMLNITHVKGVRYIYEREKPPCLTSEIGKAALAHLNSAITSYYDCMGCFFINNSK